MPVKRKKKRIFLEEPKKRFSMDDLTKELSPELYDFFLSVAKENQRIEVQYIIGTDLQFDKEGWKLIDDIRTDLHQIFRPYWLGRSKPQRGVPLPLYTDGEETDKKKFWYMPILWRSTATGAIEDCVEKILTETTMLLLPEKMRWNMGNSISIHLKTRLPYEKGYTLPQRIIPETTRFSKFDMSKDKDRVKEHYSKEITSKVIYELTKGRNIGITWASGSEQPKIWQWLDREKGERLPTPKKPEDVPKLVDDFNMIRIFTTVDKTGASNPDLFVFETDIGDVLKILNPKKGFELSFDVFSAAGEILKQNSIPWYANPTSNRGIQGWVKQVFEGPSKVYLEICERIGIENEKLLTHYGFNRVLARALGVHVIRQMPEEKRKRFSVDVHKKWLRLYKVLWDTPRNLLGVPLSFHDQSGRCYWRIGGWSLPPELKDPDLYRELSEPERVIKHAQSYLDRYTDLAPEAYQGDFDVLTNFLRKDIFLVLYPEIDPNVSADYTLAVMEPKATNLYKKFMR